MMVMAVLPAVTLLACSMPRVSRDLVGDLGPACEEEEEEQPSNDFILTAGSSRPPPVPPRPPGHRNLRDREQQSMQPGCIPGRRLAGPPDAPTWQQVFEIPWRGGRPQGPMTRAPPASRPTPQLPERRAQVAGNTGTIWDAVRATQPPYHGTVIPRSFELSTRNGRVWVHGNATEHLAEYTTWLLTRGAGQDFVNLASQQLIRSLRAAVEAATAGGVPYGRLVTVGGWELKFVAPRAEGQLPTLIHALGPR